MADEFKIVNTKPQAGAILMEISKRIRPQLVPHMMRLGMIAGGEIQLAVHQTTRDAKGTLAKSFQPPRLLRQNIDEIAVGAFSDLPYAGIRDRGGVIRPVRAKRLAIPLTSKAKNRAPREWGKALTLITSRKGNALLAEIRGKKITPHYVLKKSVKQTGTGYIEIAEKSFAARAEEETIQYLRKQLGAV